MKKKATLKEKLAGYIREYGSEIAYGYLILNGNVYATRMYSDLRK